MVVWWAKKEVPGKPVTVLGEAHFERFKVEWKVAQTERFRFLEPIVKLPANLFEGTEASRGR